MTNKRFINLFGRVNILRQCRDEITEIIPASYEFRHFDDDTIVHTEINENKMKNLSFFHSQKNITYLNIYPLYDIHAFHEFNRKLINLEHGNDDFICNVLVHDHSIDDFVFNMFARKYMFDVCYCLNDDNMTKIKKIKKMIVV